MDMSHVHQVWLKLSCKTRWNGEEDKADTTKEEVGRQRQGMDRPGVCQVPGGRGGQRKLEKTGCEVVCGVPETLAVKGKVKMKVCKTDLETGVAVFFFVFFCVCVCFFLFFNTRHRFIYQWKWEPDCNATGIICASVVVTTSHNLFLLFICKEWKDMAAPTGAKIQSFKVFLLHEDHVDSATTTNLQMKPMVTGS